MKEIIETIKARKPIKVIYDNEDFGFYEFNETTKRYEGIIGWLCLVDLKEILEGKIKHLELRVK